MSAPRPDASLGEEFGRRTSRRAQSIGTDLCLQASVSHRCSGAARQLLMAVSAANRSLCRGTGDILADP
jgi:hypothetical protein